MNKRDVALMTAFLEDTFRNWLESSEHNHIDLPMVGKDTFHHMAVSAMNILEALEDVQNHLRSQGVIEE